MDKSKFSKLLLVFGILMLAVGGFLLYSDKDKFFKSDTEVEVANSSNTPAPAVNENPNTTQNLSNYSGLYYKDNISIKVFGYKDKIDFAIVGGPELLHNSYGVVGDSFALTETCTVKLEENQKFSIICADSELTGEYEKAESYDIVSYYRDNIGDPNLINNRYFGEFENGVYRIVIYQKDEVTVGLTMINLSDLGIKYEYSVPIVGDSLLHLEENGMNFDITVDDNALTFTALDEVNMASEIAGTYTKTKIMTMETVVEFKLA